MTKLETRTQETRRANTRALLLAAAADQFAHKGFHATSAEAIAAAANRTTGALYDHFGNKSGLLVALLEGWVEQTILDITNQFDLDGGDIERRFASVWDSIVATDTGEGDQWLLLEFELWLHAVREPEMRDAGAARLEAMREGLSDGLEQWSAEFDFELPGPSHELAAQIIGLLIGAAFQHRIDNKSFSKDSVIRAMGRLLSLSDVLAPSLRNSTSP